MTAVKIPLDIDPVKMLRKLEKDRCERSLAYFVKRAWSIIEPGQPYVHGWHIDFVAAHLEAITNGDEIDGEAYNRLLVNIPPGTMKSLLVSVFWCAWEWGPKNKPHLRYVCASHSQNLAIRDNVRFRRLVSSEWYQSLWGDRVSLANDQNTKTKVENAAFGFREAAAAGSITGSRGDRVIIDDPHSVEGASSDQMRASTNEWFLEAVPTRLNNPDRSAIVVIMQRLHEDDVSGLILDKRLGYDHIMLPMRYDPRRAAPTKLGYEDPRTEDGELLFPERFPLSVVERDERVMGPYATAGQFQQEPAPRGGGIIRDEWWQLWADDTFPPFDFVCASLDTAYGEKEENDYSALTVWGVFSTDAKAMPTQMVTRDGRMIHGVEREYVQGAPNVLMVYAWQKRLAFPDLVTEVIRSCKRFGVDTLLIEAKAAGISLAQELRRAVSHETFGVRLIETGRLDKVSRLYSVQHLFAEKIVWAPDKEWAEMVIGQARNFPKAKHDDLVDTVSQAMRWLRDTGMLTRAPERMAEIENSIRFKGNRGAEPLYPA